MPRKPNYKFDRMERQRQKAARKAEKAAKKAEKKDDDETEGAAPSEGDALDDSAGAAKSDEEE